jgi:hypothetical protein
MSEAYADGDRAARRALVACAIAVALGAALRALGLGTDFWLDEVWSWSSARSLHGAAGVFTSIHSSNNNHLNTLWIYAVGADAPVWLYRLPSFVAGSASVGLGAWLAARRGRLESVFAAVLLAACFALVHFSSEARGYASAVAFAFAAQLALEATLERRRRALDAVFGACVVLGFLSHLVFLFYWAGAAAQSFWRLRARPPRELARRELALHAAPLAVLALLYAVDLRALVVGSGDPFALRVFLTELVGRSLGLPVLPVLALAYAALALALVGAGLRLRARGRDDSWIGIAVMIAASIAAFAGLRPDVIALRYFLVPIAFTMLLCADLVAAGWRAGGVRRALALCALLVFLAGNALQLRAFAELGRGGYRAALVTMAANSDDDRIRVGSDNDFRNGLVLSFYARELPPGRELVYLPRESWPPEGPEWVIRHFQHRPRDLSERVTVGDIPYRLFAEYEHAAISGFYWALYRRDRSNGGAEPGTPGSARGLP